MVYRETKFVPGFFKIVDEILVNAADNKVSAVMGIFDGMALTVSRLMILPWRLSESISTLRETLSLSTTMERVFR